MNIDSVILVISIFCITFYLAMRFCDLFEFYVKSKKEKICWRHYFQARYDISKAEIPDNYKDKKFNVYALETFRSQSYIKDVCVKCGKEINK